MDQREPDRSYESVKNDSSMDYPLACKDGRPIPLSRESPGPNCESMKSDRSMNPPLIFKGGNPVPLRKRDPGHRCESMKSDWSMSPPLIFKAGGSSGLRESASEAPQTQIQLDAIFTELEERIMMFVKEQLKRLHRLLASEHKESTSESEEEQSSSEAVLNITLDFLRRMKLKNLAEHLSIISSVGVCRSKMRRYLQQRLSHGFEGVTKAGNPIPLHQIFTELYITEGGALEVNQEHEVRHIETASRRPVEITIKCEDMFKSHSHRQPPIRAKLTEEEPIRTVLTEGQGANKKSVLKKVFESVIATYKKAPLPITADLAEEAPMKAELLEEGPIRTVLTKGVAGVGKTVLTQKVSLDWAEGSAQQDVQLLFPFTFRELNVLRDTEYSLIELLHHFFSLTKGLCSLQQLQVLFIFDGLDECRLPLDFSRTRVLTEPTESASVEVLLVNLIRGSLLPSARLWITTRPAAANQIPAECVSMVTEVRGFADPQKEQYFRKRFRDELQATAVISHIKSIHSLYIMCHIPVFCWILSTVLLHLMETRERAELPHTLTQMYIYFLVVQAKVKNIKYHEGSGADLHWTPETKKMVQSLGKLAFEQLLKGNLIFYECDLSECGLDAVSASVYSGVFTQVFREEPGLYQDKVYCFIHLSVQEFLAALHVHQTFINSGENLLLPQQSTSPDLDAFYHSAVDQALQSPNGHLDLFLRFLLGLSLPTNQRLLKGLLNETGNSAWSNQETVKYIKKKLNEGLFPERSLNLLHCLNELNDRSLVEEIQEIIRKGRLSWLNSPAEWSALSFILLSSDSDLEEFDLRKYCSSERALLGLLPLVKASTKAILSWCNLTENSCGALVSVLSSTSLTHLDLSDNPLRDSGVELLSDGLKSAPCRLQSLRLSGCLISERGGTSLASALSYIPSHLRELDLSYNHPGASTELLNALRAPHGPLHSLRLDPAGEQCMVPGVRKYSYEFTMDQNTAQRHLLLSENKRTVTCEWVEHQYPDHEDRFMELSQVLSSSGLTGRCYWEVQWRGDVNIAVSYRGIRRTGERDECEFGENDRSWRLRIYGGHYTVCHNKRETPIPFSTHLRSGRVGVFLDFEAGALSFYKVRFNGKLSHLHTFSHCFTEPMFPGFGLWAHGDSVSVVDLRKALPGGQL